MVAPSRAALLVALLPALAASSARADMVAAIPGSAVGHECALVAAGARAAADAASCLRCHPSHDAHPVDLDYIAITARRPHDLRPTVEVVRRGVFLPDGMVRCATCHDPRSPWKHHVALPPGARVRQAVDPSDESTYRPGNGRASLPVARGDAVTPTPLCLACHALD